MILITKQKIQEKSNAFGLQDYIKDIQSLNDYKCTVCFEIVPSIMQCSGPCKASICLKCATTIYQNNDQTKCPQRCSSPVRLQPIHNIYLEFKCPYDVEKCNRKIQGYQSFIDHRRKCEYMTQEAAKDELKKKDFLCQKSHSLLFLNTETSCHIFNEVSLKSFTHQCAKCSQKQVCRAYCNQCSQENKIEAYCNECRPLPCTKMTCPIGHQFVKETVENKKYFCSLCGFCIFLYSDKYLCDDQCNICICEPCSSRLPDNCHLNPLKVDLSHVEKHCNYLNKPIIQIDPLVLQDILSRLQRLQSNIRDLRDRTDRQLDNFNEINIQHIQNNLSQEEQNKSEDEIIENFQVSDRRNKQINPTFLTICKQKLMCIFRSCWHLFQQTKEIRK